MPDKEWYEIQKIIDRRRAFQEAIRPLILQKAKILSMCTPTWVITGCCVETTYPKWVTDAWAQIDELIECVKRSFEEKEHA